ncbi:MAG: tRNA (N6-isopentenyl adenosine(37)-C2)-methylthiotransferase MiaB [Oscillospiraceae bacterium]|nr:tRNA (N6-isopentenyl adenosine(37)-C2)-methylthiotransferase MiaB [Oscillospiraceae bacterium]
MTLFIRTFGCQQNVRDSEMAAGLLTAQGYALCDAPEAAHVIFINTCTVRDHAENKALSYIGRLKFLKRKNPELRIIVCGCMVAQPDMAKKLQNEFPQIDIIIAPDALPKLPELLRHSLSDGTRAVDIEEDDAWHEQLPVVRGSSGQNGKRDALVTVMRGCDNYCSYCIVPYVRGRERSRGVGDIVDEITQAIAEGYKTIMLLGQNVNAYRDGDCDFPALLRKINALDGNFSISFMTSHPKDANLALFQAMADCSKVEKHLHLPFQAGSDAMLSAMNRKYTREEYLTKIEQLRELIPDVRLTSDVIVGFPSESDADFEDTLSLLETVRFKQLFTFLFSPRKDTPAASMENVVPEDVKKARFMRLLEVQRTIENTKL